MTPSAPAFMVYAADEDAELAALPLAAVGAFHRLRCHQWLMGSIPDPSTPAGLAAIASVLRVAPSEARRLRPFIEQLFGLGADGERRWAPLEDYRRKLEEHRRALVAGGRRGGRTKWERVRAAEAPDSQASSHPTSQASSHPMSHPYGPAIALQSPSSSPSSELHADQATGSSSATVVGARWRRLFAEAGAEAPPIGEGGRRLLAELEAEGFEARAVADAVAALVRRQRVAGRPVVAFAYLAAGALRDELRRRSTQPELEEGLGEYRAALVSAVDAHAAADRLEPEIAARARRELAQAEGLGELDAVRLVVNAQMREGGELCTNP